MQSTDILVNALELFLEEDVSTAIVAKGASILKKIICCVEDNGEIEGEVRGSKGEQYDVFIAINETQNISATCTCPYYENELENCKHIAAVAKYYIEENQLEENIITQTPKNVQAKMVNLKKLPKSTEPLPLINMEMKLEYLPDYWDLRGIYKDWQKVMSSYTNHWQHPIKSSDDGKRFDLINLKDKLHQFVEKKDKKNYINIGCNCTHFKAIEPCLHIWGLLYLLNQKTNKKFYFNQFDDYTEEKNKLLKPYGFDMEDAVAAEFQFAFLKDGKICISQIPNGLLPKFSATDSKWIEATKRLPLKKVMDKKTATPAEVVATDTLTNNKKEEPFDTGILFNLNSSALQGFRIEGIKITHKGDKLSFTSQKLRTKLDLAMFGNAPLSLQNALLGIVDESLISMLKEETTAHNISEAQPFRSLTQEQIDLINVEYKIALKEMGDYLAQLKYLYYLPNGLSFAKSALKPCRFSAEVLEHKVQLKQTDKTISLELILYGVETNTFITNYTTHKFVILQNDTFYFTPTGIGVLKKYLPHNKLMAPIAAKNDFIKQIVLPLSYKIKIDFNNVIKIETIIPTPQPRIYLSELNEKYLMITPKWLYEDFEMDNDREKITTVELEDGILNIERNPNEENIVIESIRKLHPSFANQNNEYFYLHFDEVMKKHWFLTMYQQLQELNVPIFGMNNLKRFKYNTNTAKMEFKTGSGTDWFDIRMEVSYGNQIVPLATLRKAIINKQQFILLGDGTLGMLPDEWIKKFATIMRMGTVKDDGLQVSKLHWTIIDQLHEQQNGEAVFEEILAKKQKLKEIENIKNVKLPSNIKALLRDYQKSGFQWMNMLDEMGWGGCLADDMGLGKTLQTLTFLSGIQKKYKGETHLIVCPTSLIYNWESEINKFTPHLKYHINYGTERELTEHDVSNANIIITSYGILRSDIEKFTKYKYGYVILDESQAIKNHLSQTAKAVGLIKSRNRLILSGTPVQNNTFDLYSQFNFINPGLLGNMEFFKTEFANAIDRDNDKQKKDELRKLIYPFMLRRTKEQVAKDLPAKTESILWCEMETKQRTIYNSFKDDYRKTILKKIEEEGFAKAGIFILAGLTKLRQICDSPAILNEEEAYPNASIKIDELLREIEENASNHKALVFSQFTSMLGLIAKELDSRKIKYYYLDGSTKARDRKIAVTNFQENEEVKIFLISLKAGGVGLNLTAADYVYMVDPWWNPAAEQQAIDRTHRIGQNKSVFAYKLICKDSIEEKILQLQQKKKALSADLISDENGFVKKLTKEDVAYLFS